MSIKVLVDALTAVDNALNAVAPYADELGNAEAALALWQSRAAQACKDFEVQSRLFEEERQRRQSKLVELQSGIEQRQYELGVAIADLDKAKKRLAEANA